MSRMMGERMPLWSQGLSEEVLSRNTMMRKGQSCKALFAEHSKQRNKSEGSIGKQAWCVKNRNAKRYNLFGREYGGS